MEGYIHYDRYSQYSPESRFQIEEWSSPSEAIEKGGKDPYSVILFFVSARKDLFYPVRNYYMVGTYYTYLNRAIKELYLPREEEVDIDSYIYPLNSIYDVPGITIKRNLYQLKKVGENIYRQYEVLPLMEQYTLATIPVIVDGKRRDTPLYIGSEGSFLLFHSMPKTIRMTSEDKDIRIGGKERRNRRSCIIDKPPL
jgi:hypothetical protein